MVQVNNRFGENVYLPYSVGLLYAYAKTFLEINDAYEMCGFLYLKEAIKVAVSKLESPDLVCISIYIWNFEWSKLFASAVKEKWPSCIILVGGVQVPDESPRILEENTQFDAAIYGEGEGAFADFLREHAGEQRYWQVGSLIWRTDGEICVNPRRPFTDLAELRSPYLDGVFDELLPLEKRYQVVTEFDRGCPYLCSYCAWGQAAMNELRLFPEERIRAELEWFGQHKIDYLDQGDSNFAIVKRDVDLARYLVDVKKRCGYPRTFRTSFAKNSNEVVWEVANILNDAEMLKSVTLALQSLDDGVLVNIRRKNIKFDKFGALVKRYADAGIPTYTEIILGLPGETFETFASGIERCLDAGQASGIFTYCNIMLENTEQNTPEYISRYSLVATDMQAMLSHGTPDNTVVRERQSIITSTSTMPHEDWKRAYLFGKVVEVFHAQGLLQDVAIALHERGVHYRDFYVNLLDWCFANPTTVAGREMAGVAAVLDRALAGGSWDLVDPKLGEISWPPEEFAFARICLEKDKFYDEIEDFLLGQGVEDDEIAKQREVIAAPWEDTVAWSREVVWYSRKGSAVKMRQARTGGE